MLPHPQRDIKYYKQSKQIIMRVFLIITLFALSLFALVVLFCAVLMLWTIEPFAGILGAFSLLVSLVLIALEALDKKSNY